jgi:hypothetical protein
MNKKASPNNRKVTKRRIKTEDNAQSPGKKYDPSSKKFGPSCSSNTYISKGNHEIEDL